MQPLVVDYLKTHTLRELEEDHGVASRPSSRFDKFSLNYDQLLVKNGDPLAEQCRGLIVRPSAALIETMLNDEAKRDRSESVQAARWRDRVIGDVEVLAWPMNRFYNLGDGAGAQVWWGDPQLRVYEKLDGTMIVAYWDSLHKQWFAATRAVPEADLPIRLGDMEAGDLTFSGLFFTALRATREDITGEPLDWEPEWINEVIKLNKEFTYVFELTGPINRVVVKYNDSRVTLLAARHTLTGKEVPVESIKLQHVPRPKTWDLRDPTAIDAFVNSADPALLEGCVVCDSNFRRLKVKNKAWVLSSKAKDLVTVSRRSALESIIAGTIDDVIPLVAQDVADVLSKMQDQLRLYLQHVDSRFVDWKDQAQGDRKRFAQLVVGSGEWSTPFFQLLDGKANSARDWAVNMQQSGKLTDKTLDSFLNEMKSYA